MLFWLTVVTVNWGRGYDPGEFGANVRRLLTHIDPIEHVVVGVQELDEEPDPAHEKRSLARKLEPGTHKVGWNTREPLLLSPGFDRVYREQVAVTMEAGGKIGAPRGTGPTRHAVTAMGEAEGVSIGFGNTHPHLNKHGNPKIAEAKREGLAIYRDELMEMYRLGAPVVWTGDMNDLHLGPVMPGERTAIHRGNDYIRYRNNPKSPIRLQLAGAGKVVEGTIDPHDPLWARFRVVQREA